MNCAQQILRRLTTVSASLLLPVIVFTATALPAATVEDGENESLVSLVGVAHISGDALDHSGLNQILVPEGGTTQDLITPGSRFTNDMLGGISAIAWTGEENLYWFLPDRGPLDGAVDWACRIHKIRLTIAPLSKVSLDSAPATEARIKTELVETVLLKDHRGIPFTGLASAYDASEARTRRLDPEGIRVGENGNVFVSDEYGPRIIEFQPTGQMVREFEIPNHYQIENPGVSSSTENTNNVSGRQCNRGMEGLAISIDRKRLFGLMQSPLLQDSIRPNNSDKPIGINCRLPVFDVNGGFHKEYLYRLDETSNKLNEILVYDENQFLTIERDGEAGELAKYKKVMLISIAQASNISDHKTLPADACPEGVQGVSKQVLVDLLDPKWNLAGSQMPEKIEGLAFGPNFPNGDRMLVVASDNDFVSANPTQIYVFRLHQKR